jgi:hypothetical protein
MSRLADHREMVANQGRSWKWRACVFGTHWLSACGSPERFKGEERRLMKRDSCLDLIAFALWVAASASGFAQSLPGYPCFNHHGRLWSGNGIAHRIWLIGTNRIVAVDEDFELPAGTNKYLDVTTPEYSFIYGNFELCPLGPDVPGHMRRVRLVHAEKLVVQNLNNSQPPFRLISTWPQAHENAKRK